MAKRLVRAKHKIANARIPCWVPPASALPQRIPDVLAVLYLVFNEGYSASAGDDLIRRDLCDRAVALASGASAELLARFRRWKPWELLAWRSWPPGGMSRRLRSQTVAST